MTHEVRVGGGAGVGDLCGKGVGTQSVVGEEEFFLPSEIIGV